MDAQFWLDKLTENISYQLRHANYDRTVEIRDFSHSMSTGENQFKELSKYRRWEADDLKAQRNRVTNTLTKYALARLRKYFKWVDRVDGIRTNLEAADEAKLAELKTLYQSFMPGMTMEQWVLRMVDTKAVTDPNAWVVCERQNITGQSGQVEGVRPYAFVFPSVDALNFERDYIGNVSWFIGRTSTMEHIIEQGLRRERVLENYYLYAPGFAARAREKGEKNEIEAGEIETTLQIFPPFGTMGTQSTFFVMVVENGTKETPAIPFGCYIDEATESMDTFVPWFWPAEHLLKDLVFYKSTEALSIILHAYLKRWEFEKECTFHDDRGQCEGGYINGSAQLDHICPVCKGTGFPANFTTEQASVKLILPADADAQAQLIDLSKLSFTESIPIDFLKYIGEKLEMVVAAIKSCIFDVGLYQKPNDTKERTATEVQGEMEGVSDVLKPYVTHISRVNEFFWRVGSQYMEFDIIVDHSYPEDLRMTKLADEVTVLGEMTANGAGFSAIAAQTGRVYEKVFEGQPVLREQQAAKLLHQPFAGHTPESVAMIVAGRSEKDDTRVLWENFENVFIEIFKAKPDFGQMTFEAQKAMVQAKVEEFKARIEVTEPEPIDAPNFNEPIEPDANA